MRRAAAFTLIEVLAVILLTGLVIGVALNHYIELSRATERATEHTREIRRATALLDRVGRDLQSAILVETPPDVDPLANPYLFLGESRRSEFGADHLKFVTRGHRPRASDAHESDLQMVAYAFAPAEDGSDSYELLRWASPHLPEGLDREIPTTRDEGAWLLADGLAEFGVTFYDEAGEESVEWDSSQLVDASQLPAAVEIRVAYAHPDALEEEFDPEAELDGGPRSYRRRVLLPVRPLSLEELLDPTSVANGGPGNAEEGEDGEDEEDEGRESAQCLASPCANMTACQAINCAGKQGTLNASMNQLIERTIASNPGFCEWRYGIPKQIRPVLIDNPACR